MRSLEQIERVLETPFSTDNPDETATQYVQICEEILENWITKLNKIPTLEKHEGFRLLALQKQGANKNPSFNACRETCREAIYHANLITQTSDLAQKNSLIAPLRRIVMQLLYFIILETQQLRDSSVFCCSSKSLQTN